ncbi:hypothetical protein V8C34DRAFT_99768 [Trichoderma compactum]
MDGAPLDLYQILGVSRDAQVAEIRLAYGKQVLQHHPDKVQDPVLKAQKIYKYSKIQQAYETLTNEEELKNYDDRVKLVELNKQLQTSSLLVSQGRQCRNVQSSSFGQLFKRSPAASSRQPASPTSPATSSSQNIQKQSGGSRQGRFRRSSKTSRPHRDGSRGSRGSQNSTRSVGSQVSWEDTDKFDYILQTMKDLVDEHIKRLKGRFWRHESASPPKRQCREVLFSFQRSIQRYIGVDHALYLDAGTGPRYEALLELFDELRLELIDFANHDLSIRKTNDLYCEEFCEKINMYQIRLDLCS